ncbi:ABC transporter substrate-binding protein [Microbacterium sp. HD4P20]|uniref:ABC transporter substrate-binding protein n=1 Tax=Microbacterium sp. HD4P20 TaxID=2864874 RepID=UPI001C63D43C|nr:ABC transporter substrate-binding protein [Microbacterium sp. HD4P20]MCP2635684.1 ABC transporter substrate-binding protein [Microbacterium sp. HD4P20]
MKNRYARRTIGIVGALAAAALVMSGCTGGNADAAGEEKVYVQAIGDDPMGLNAQLVSGAAASMFSAQIFDTLIRIDDAGELSPGLAEEWELSDDGLELTLHLRDGVTWHDGEPFTAEDVKFNLEEIVELQTFGAALAARIAGVEVVDETTAVVTFTEVFGPVLETLAQQFMIPKHIYEGTDYVTNEANMEPIGTGPMMFDSYESGQQVVLLKNPEYWDGEVQVDRAVYPVMTDPNSRASALFAGEVDRAELDPSQQKRVEEDSDLDLMTEGFFAQAITVMMNGLSPELTDPAVRAAVFAALDREAITDVALSGLGEPTTGFFPPSLEWALNTDVDFERDFPRDTDAINEALDEAGFPRGSDGLRFTLDVRYISELSEVAATAEMAKSQLEEVGIGLNLVGTSASVFTEKVYTTSEFDLSFLRSTVGADPSTGIVRWYACNPNRAAASNPSQICDEEIQAAADGALGTTDRAQRGEHLKDLQQRASELMFYAPLSWYYGSFPTVSSKRWEGQLDAVATTNTVPWTTMTLK